MIEKAEKLEWAFQGNLGTVIDFCREFLELASLNTVIIVIND